MTSPWGNGARVDARNGWSGRVHPFVAAAFVVVAFSMPFEARAGLPIQLSTVAATLFVAIAALQARVTFQRPPAAFWWLAAFLWVYLARSVWSVRLAESMHLFALFLLSALLFWVSCNVLREERVAYAAIVAFVAGCTLLAGLEMSGIGATVVDPGARMRLTAFDQDANMLGGNMALALTAIVALVFVGRPTRWYWWVASTTAAAVLARALIDSGSRGAIVGLAAGLVALVVGAPTARTLARNLGIAVVAAAVLLAAGASYAPLRQRVQRTLATGDMAGRENIYPEAWQLWLEKPAVGWGPVDARYELRWRTAFAEIDKAHHASERDAHNIVLEQLMATGVAGTAPFLICIGLAVGAAWRARRGRRGVAPLALIAVVLVLGMSANWANARQAWLLFAYGIASVPVPVLATRQPRDGRRPSVQAA